MENIFFIKQLTTQSLTQFSTPSESSAYLRGISASMVSLHSLSAGIGNYLLSKASSVYSESWLTCFLLTFLRSKALKTMDQTNNSSHRKWIPLTSSALFMLRHGKLMVLSLFLFILTLGITWLCYHVSIGFVDNLTGDFFLEVPQTLTIWGWIKHKGWLLLKWLFLISTRIIAFYLAFLTAYCLTTPGYVILSTATEKYQAGMQFDLTESTKLKGLVVDLKGGINI